MNSRVRHIFIFVFIFSVFSLTLQSSITNFCKDSKAFKGQNQSNPVSEEEEETHDSDDEVFFTDHSFSFTKCSPVLKIFWPKVKDSYLSFTKSIPIPPPKA